MQEPYLPLKERLPVGKSRTEIVTGYVLDALFLVSYTLSTFYTLHGTMRALSLAPLACYGASKIWYSRKCLAPRLRKLIGHWRELC